MRRPRTISHRLAAAACAMLVAGTASSQETAQPFFDGLCDEYAAMGVPAHSLGAGVELYVHGGPETVWLCYTLPPDSYGTLDLYISTPALADPLNLHVSAQLGEWRAGHRDEGPHGASSPLWWKIDGWYSNAASFNGSVDTDDGRRPNFLASAGRELALQRSRFGSGEWRLRFQIGAVQLPDGERITVQFPSAESGEEYFLINVGPGS